MVTSAAVKEICGNPRGGSDKEPLLTTTPPPVRVTLATCSTPGRLRNQPRIVCTSSASPIAQGVGARSVAYDEKCGGRLCSTCCRTTAGSDFAATTNCRVSCTGTY